MDAVTICVMILQQIVDTMRFEKNGAMDMTMEKGGKNGPKKFLLRCIFSSKLVTLEGTRGQG